MFGIKDIFTTINLMGGVVAVCLCIEGHPYAAGISILIGYAAGDMVDGWVARKLNSANQFGAEYDTISDHMSHIVAPAAIVYTVYRDADLLPSPYGEVLAMALAGSVVVGASIRHARNIVRPLTFDGVWAGLPRSVHGFMAMAYVNAGLAPFLPGGLWIGVVLIPLLTVWTLTRIPFANHRFPRKHFWYVRVLVASFLILQPLSAFLAPDFFFDIFFFFVFGYSGTAWMALTPSEHETYRKAVQAVRES